MGLHLQTVFLPCHTEGMIREIHDHECDAFDRIATHVMQSSTWGAFRKATGLSVVRLGVFDKHDHLVRGLQITIHPIPKTPWTIGYVPKGPLPNTTIIHAVRKVGRKHRCIFIQLEPNVVKERGDRGLPSLRGLKAAAHPLFTKYNFLLDLTQSEEELLKNMHHKTRYNIRLAKRNGVLIETSSTAAAFEHHLSLYMATVRRQKYFGHNTAYHRTLYHTLQKSEAVNVYFVQAWTRERTTLLASWMLLHFHDILYYPYGGSSLEHRELMASNLVAWEAIQLGKKLGCTTMDMWGALGEDASPKDPWFGFHRFKQGYGGKLVEYVGSYDLILHPLLYKSFVIADKIRWFILRLRP